MLEQATSHSGFYLNIWAQRSMAEHSQRTALAVLQPAVQLNKRAVALQTPLGGECRCPGSYLLM
jgi:hypothetical protein